MNVSDSIVSRNQGSRRFSRSTHSRGSQRVQAQVWNGLFSWVSDCPRCPLLYFEGNYTSCSEALDETSGDPERRKQYLQHAKQLIQKQQMSEALKELLSLAKAVSYKVNEEECALLMHTAEIVVRNQLQAARQVAHKDIGHAIESVEGSMSVSASTANDEGISVEKEELRNLLLTLVDVWQAIRQQSYDNPTAAISETTVTKSVDGSISWSSASAYFDPFCIYLSLFSLFIQSAFLEGGLVSGEVHLNRLVSNAAETYFLTCACKEKRLDFLKPLAAYIYGRLWCETAKDERDGVHILSIFYDLNEAEFVRELERNAKNEAHSTYLCNMRRIRETLRKYENQGHLELESINERTSRRSSRCP